MAQMYGKYRLSCLPLVLRTFGEVRPAHAGRDQFAVLTARVDATSCSVSLEIPNNRARGLAISDLRRLCGVSTLDNPLPTTK